MVRLRAGEITITLGQRRPAPGHRHTWPAAAKMLGARLQAAEQDLASGAVSRFDVSRDGVCHPGDDAGLLHTEALGEPLQPGVLLDGPGGVAALQVQLTPHVTDPEHCDRVGAFAHAAFSTCAGLAALVAAVLEEQDRREYCRRRSADARGPVRGLDGGGREGGGLVEAGQSKQHVGPRDHQLSGGEC